MSDTLTHSCSSKCQMSYDCSSPYGKLVFPLQCLCTLSSSSEYIYISASGNYFEYFPVLQLLSSSLALNVFITLNVGNQHFIKHSHGFQDSWSCDLMTQLTSSQKIRLHFKCFTLLKNASCCCIVPGSSWVFPGSARQVWEGVSAQSYQSPVFGFWECLWFPWREWAGQKREKGKHGELDCFVLYCIKRLLLKCSERWSERADILKWTTDCVSFPMFCEGTG